MYGKVNLCACINLIKGQSHSITERFKESAVVCSPIAIEPTDGGIDKIALCPKI